MALLQAVKEGYVKGIKELISNGGLLGLNVNEMGTTPLIEACKFGNKEVAKRMVKILLKHGANVNHRDKDGRSALHWISMTGDKHLVNLLVESQTSIEFDITDRQGNSMLFYAVQTGKCSFVRHICKLYKVNSVRDRGKNRNGISAADLAMNLGHKKCSERCKEVTLKDNRGLEPVFKNGPVIKDGKSTCINDLNEQVVLPPITHQPVEEAYKPGKAVPKFTKKTQGGKNVYLGTAGFHPQVRSESAQSDEIVGMIDYKVVLSDLNWMQAVESTSSYRAGVDEKARLETINARYKSLSEPGYIPRKNPLGAIKRVKHDKTTSRNRGHVAVKATKNTRRQDGIRR